MPKLHAINQCVCVFYKLQLCSSISVLLCEDQIFNSHRRIHNKASAWIVMEQEIVVVSGSGSLDTENYNEQQHLKKKDRINICICVFVIFLYLCLPVHFYR